MSEWLHDPLGLGILAATAITLLVTWTRLANVSAVLLLLVILLGAEAGRFDGRQYVTPKFDASFFVWGRAVELRALAGLAIMVLGPPCGKVVGTLARARRGAFMGAIAIGPFGLGLFASSVLLQVSARRILQSDMAQEERLEHLQLAIHRSTWILGFATIVSVLACLVLAIRFVRRPTFNVGSARSP